MRFEKIWVKQCRATKGIKKRFGAKSALDYLIGEKLVVFAQEAEHQPKFAKELPRFLAGVWQVFNQYELAGYVASQKLDPLDEIVSLRCEHLMVYTIKSGDCTVCLTLPDKCGSIKKKTDSVPMSVTLTATTVVRLANPMNRRYFVLPAILLTSCRSSQRKQRPAVRIAVGGRAALDYIPVYLASALGFFEHEGIDVTLQDLPSTAKAFQALLGGSTDFIVGGYEGAIQMRFEGKSVEAIAILERWPPFALVVSPDSAPFVRTIADLKNRTVGVASLGSSTHRFLNYLLVKNGLLPSDIIPVSVGVNFSMAAAVEHGKVSAAVAGPLGVALLSKHLPPLILADCRTEDGVQATLGTSMLPFSSLMVQGGWAPTHTAVIRKVGNATRRSLAWIQSHSPDEIGRAMPREYRGDDLALYLTAVRQIKPAFSPDGLMLTNGPMNVTRLLSASDQRARNATVDLSTTYTNQFIRPQ